MSIRRACPSLLRERRGLAAIEFAITAPVMLVLLLGTIELGNAFRVQMKLNTAAGQLAELVAGRPTITAPAGSLADMCTGAMMNLYPYGTSMASADIASVTNDHPSNRTPGNTDSTSVATYLDWENLSSCGTRVATGLGLGGAFALANSPLSLLTRSGLPASGTSASSLVSGASAIVVQVRYPYVNVLPWLLGATLSFSAVAVARPRSNVTIQCTTTAGRACPLTQ